MKLYLIGGLALALMAFSYWAYGQVYDSGYGAAVSKMQEDAIRRQNDAIASARAEWELTVSVAEVEIIVEERIVEKIRVIERKIPFLVTKIVEVRPECGDLGPDFLGLFNEAISASNSRGAEDPTVTTQLDYTLQGDAVSQIW